MILTVEVQGENGTTKEHDVNMDAVAHIEWLFKDRTERPDGCVVSFVGSGERVTKWLVPRGSVSGFYGQVRAYQRTLERREYGN